MATSLLSRLILVREIVVFMVASALARHESLRGRLLISILIRQQHWAIPPPQELTSEVRGLRPIWVIALTNSSLLKAVLLISMTSGAAAPSRGGAARARGGARGAPRGGGC